MHNDIFLTDIRGYDRLNSVKLIPQKRTPGYVIDGRLDIQFDKAEVARVGESGVPEEQAGGHEDEVFRVLEEEQRDAGAAEGDVVGGDGKEVAAGVAATAKDEREAGGDEGGEAGGEQDERPVEADDRE